MDVKDQVLSVLENNRDRYVSGEELAKSMYVSRNAVWKAIKQLRAEGHSINAVTNKGYCLSGGDSIMSRQSVEKYLVTKGLDLRVFKSVDSTNTYLKTPAEEGAKEGTVAIAEEQTQGRGRFGRSFYSPGGSGIYISILLRPSLSASQALLITTCAAVAVANAIERVSDRRAEIKWVNDVYIDGKKVCGILTEASLDMESGGLNYAILGIGINIYMPSGNFPDEIKNTATAIFDKKPDSDCRSRLAAAVIDEFMSRYKNIDSKEYLNDYRNRSMITGKRVTVIRGSERFEATAGEIDDDLRLEVVTDDGKREFLSSGEVSIKPM